MVALYTLAEQKSTRECTTCQTVMRMGYTSRRPYPVSQEQETDARQVH